jgi:hypothetical protein
MYRRKEECVREREEKGNNNVKCTNESKEIDGITKESRSWILLFWITDEYASVEDIATTISMKLVFYALAETLAFGMLHCTVKIHG